MARIRILPPDIVSRIAAGEVIERPASVVKELVENSIDAHATSVWIELEDGGRKTVTVRDNGSGMDADDLLLAFESHATSKLDERAFHDDTLGAATLGFRGEALASIASVADVEILSRPSAAEHACRLRVGRGAPEPAAGEPGTTVEVRGLFCRVPARRKFLLAGQTELSHVLRQVTRLALAHPAVHFRLTQQGRKIVEWPAAPSLRERLLQVVGPERGSQLVDVCETVPGGPGLRGFAGRPELRHGDTSQQFFFVGGRWVRDRLLAHAVRSAYQGYLVPGKHPVVHLHLDFPAGTVDVNVHPTKSEVRFREPGTIYPLVYNALRRALDGRGAAAGEGHVGSREPPLAGGRAAGTGGGEARAGETDSASARIERAARDFFAVAGEREEPPAWGRRPPRPGGRPGADGEPATGPRQAPAAGIATAPERRRAFQILNAYIVVEEEGGIQVIDQHALHEKILYEEILRHLGEGGVARQRLLVPEVVELPLEQVPLTEEAIGILERCGFEVEPFGEREVAVHAVPELCARAEGSAREAVLQVFRWLGDEGSRGAGAPEVRERQLHRLASLLACKRAVKAGAALSDEEVESLLRRTDLARDPRHCPHGRPTTVFLSQGELERRFDRR